MRESGPVAQLFRSLVAEGHITPVRAMEDLRLPGELTHVPSYVSYGTPDVPPRSGSAVDAKLGYNP
jgi:hypothetical protein